jgi:hypothetical protein
LGCEQRKGGCCGEQSDFIVLHREHSLDFLGC